MTQNQTPSWDVLPQPTPTPIDQLREHPDNPRTITEGNFEALKASMTKNPELMRYKPLLILDGMVYAGNQRLKAARELGWTEIPTVDITDLTDQQRIDLLIIDNIPYGAWDENRITQRWASLLDHEILPSDHSWSWVEVVEPEIDPDTIEDDNFEPDLGKQTDIQLGDLFQIGPHRLLCGSATSITHWEKLMKGADADCLLTDPPYNVDYEGTDGMKILNDKMEDTAFLEFLTDTLQLAMSYTKEGGAAYVFHADSEGRNFRNAFEDAGWLLKQCLVWVKNTFTIGRQDYQWAHEPILYGWKPGAAHYFTHHRDQSTVIPRGDLRKLTKAELLGIIEAMTQDTQTTVIEENKPKRNALHPTMKPLNLCARLIRNSTRGQELIIDPFIGSGSTMVAAHQMNRRVYGMDLDPVYCQAVLDRMRELDPEITITKIK